MCVTDVTPIEEIDDLPEQMQIRRDKRVAILSSGEDAYPVTVPVTTTVSAIRQ